MKGLCFPVTVMLGYLLVCIEFVEVSDVKKKSMVLSVPFVFIVLNLKTINTVIVRFYLYSLYIPVICRFISLRNLSGASTSTISSIESSSIIKSNDGTI